MKVLNVTNKYYNNQSTFKSTTSFYKTDAGKEIGSNSWMFREDVAWNDLAKFEVEHFRDKNRVNVIQFASSDGSEAYTKIISLLKQGEPNVQKFFPIEAYDISPEIVNAAKSGLINFVDKDFKRAENVQVNLDEYFKKSTNSLDIKNDYMFHFFNIPTTTYQVSNSLKNKVNFHNKDLFDVLHSFKDDSNSVILCRNIFSYFDDIDARRAINLLGQKLKAGSLLVLGDQDFSKHTMQKFLKEAGFSAVDFKDYSEIKTLKNVFVKNIKTAL